MEGGPSRFPRGFTCPAVLRILPSIVGFRLQGFYLLWLGFPANSPNLSSNYEVLQPHRTNAMVWALPSSLAATTGIEFSFSSSGYLDVSVPRVVFFILFYSDKDGQILLQPGCPIRISPDQSLLTATRSFSQLTTSFFDS